MKEQRFSPQMGSSIDEFKDLLRSKSYDQLAMELEEKLLEGDEAERLPEVAAYIEVLEEKLPSHDEVDPEKELAAFKRKVEQRPVMARPRCRNQVVLHRKAQRILMGLAVLFVLLVGSEALGFNWKQVLVTWKNELLVVKENQCGQMELPNDVVTDYGSLHEVVTAYGLGGLPLEPTWIPDDFSIIEVAVNEGAGHTDIHAIYGDGVEKEIFVRILVQQNGTVPAIGYEKNDDDEENVYSVHGLDVDITQNYNLFRGSWDVDDTYFCSISGDLTEDQLKQMINSIFEVKEK